MHLLLIHQNFPGQFRDLAPAWLKAGHTVSAIGMADFPHYNSRWDGLTYHQYDLPSKSTPSPLERGQAIAAICRQLQQQGLHPDLVITHSAWGEALQLHHVFPDIAQISLPELWGTPQSLGGDFDQARKGDRPSKHLFVLQNLLTELAIAQSAAVLVASQSQKESFPTALKKRLTVIPEGLDLNCYNPDKHARLSLSKLEIRAGQPLVTLVARNLEPLRGLRQALKAWPAVAKAVPNAQLLLVGGTDQGYGDEQPTSDSHLNDALSALPQDVDRSRIHHLGRLEHPTMVQLLQCSACHLALSYPYTLSWSVLEAMACGAPIITNVGSPISSDLTHHSNSLIVPFNDTEALGEAMVQLLLAPELREKLGQGGRTVIVNKFNLKTTLLTYEKLFLRLVSQASEANQRSN